MIIEDLNNKKAEVSSNCLEVNKFTIEASSQAFRILSSSLYANKIESIVRELSCNARDAHVEAGNLEKFEIHVPSTFEPYFSVRDYGVGLSDEEVRTIYTTYFKSTKTASNKMIGALGLGSKSPFSYTDNFTVVACKDQEKNTYSAFINDDGVPSVVRLNTEKTEDPNGLTVQFAVNPRDFFEFTNSAKNALKYFSPEDMPTGNIRIDPHVPTFFEVFGESIESVNTGYYTKVPYAIMGGVGYRIDSSHPKLASIKTTLDYGLILRFDIGQIEPQPSREVLTYSNLTVDSILAKVNEIIGRIKIVVQENHDKLDSTFSKISLLNSMENNLIAKTSAGLIKKSLGYDKCEIDIDLNPNFGTIRRISSFNNSLKLTTEIQVFNLHVSDFSENFKVFINDKKVKIREIKDNIRNFSKFVTGIIIYPGPEYDENEIKNIFYGATLHKLSDFKMFSEEKPKKVKIQYYYYVTKNLSQYKYANHKFVLKKLPKIIPEVEYFMYADRNIVQIPVKWALLGLNQDRLLNMIHKSQLSEKVIIVSKSTKIPGLKSFFDFLETTYDSIKDDQDKIEEFIFKSMSPYLSIDYHMSNLKKIKDRLDDPEIRRLIDLKERKNIDDFEYSIYNLFSDNWGIKKTAMNKINSLSKCADKYNVIKISEMNSDLLVCLFNAIFNFKEN